MFQFDADLNSIDTGVWAEWSGSRFLIAHISNMGFQKRLALLQQPHRKKLESGSLDPQINRDILCKAMSETILLDWDKVISRSGEPTVFSVQNAFSVLQRDPEFRDFVAEFSTQMANYRAEEVAELGKSLKTG
jgi:hypothetical protein